MKPRFSLVINHTPWRPERVAALRSMRMMLEHGDVPVLINDRDWRGTEWQQSKVQWALDQWRWAAKASSCSHHVFMTDDLHVAPHFWRILAAMVEAVPNNTPIGLLSNHPRGPALSSDTEPKRFYRTNSWLVGPAYVLPHAMLLDFLVWFEGLPEGAHTTYGTKAYRNDDSSINQFISTHGFETWHPLPTIIEHRGDVDSTVGHGDRYSRERLSWRHRRWVEDAGEPGSFVWNHADAQSFDLGEMSDPKWWRIDNAPLLPLGE